MHECWVNISSNTAVKEGKTSVFDAIRYVLSKYLLN